MSRLRLVSISLALVAAMNASARAQYQEHPALAPFGDHFLVVWSQHDGGASRLHWSRVYGCTLDGPSARLTTGYESELRPAAASGADWGLVVWEAWDAYTPRVRAAEIGTALPAPLPSAALSGAGTARRPSCAILEDTGLVLWEEDGRILHSRWSRGGGAADPGGIETAPSPDLQHTPRVAAGSDGFLAVWSEAPPAGPARVVALRFDAAATRLGTAAVVSDTTRPAHTPDVAAGGERFLAAWNVLDPGSAAIAAVFLDAAGLPLSPVHELAGGPAQNFVPRVAAGAEGFHLLWVVQDAGGRGLLEAVVGDDGGLDPVGGREVAPRSSFAADPAIAARPGVGLCAWRRPAPEDADSLETACWLENVGGSAEPAVRLRLPSAWPNPFRNSVTVDVGAGISGSIRVLDVRGRLVRSLPVDPGTARVTWDGRTDGGVAAPAGKYLILAPGADRGVAVVKGD